MNVEGSLLLT